MWASVIAKGSLLDDAGPGAKWREPTRRGRRYAYGAWLVFLDGRGWLDPAVDPADRVTPERIAAYIEHLKLRLAPLSVWTQIDQLSALLVAGRPSRDWSWLRKAAARLEATA
jgi:hypothetical protein